MTVVLIETHSLRPSKMATANMDGQEIGLQDLIDQLPKLSNVRDALCFAGVQNQRSYEAIYEFVDLLTRLKRQEEAKIKPK